MTSFINYKDNQKFTNLHKKGGWIQKATASIKKRGTEGVCTGSKFGGPSCPPGSKRYNLAKTFKKMLKKRKHQGGGLIRYLQSGISVPPTRADSIALLANVNALRNYYEKSGNYKKSIQPSTSTLEAIDVNNKRVIKQMENRVKQNQESTVMRKGYPHANHEVVPLQDYYRKIDENKYLKREDAYQYLDLRSPMQLIDKRITPKTEYIFYNEGIDDSMRNDVVVFFGYHPLQVAPWDKLTDDQRRQRQRMFGRNTNEPDMLNIPKTESFIKRKLTTVKEPSIPESTDTTVKTQEPQYTLVPYTVKTIEHQPKYFTSMDGVKEKSNTTVEVPVTKTYYKKILKQTNNGN